MDVDASRWILEFLIRQPVPDGIVNAVLKVLPLSNNDLRLKKTILLRAVQSKIADASVSEAVLEMLEIIEELDRSNGVAIMESMRAAYCAVAVECTVKYLGGSADKHKYLDAVNRIWSEKIGKMERSGKCGLVSTELREWRNDIEAAVWDTTMCNNLLKKNTRNDALRLVRAYLGEAWAIMGPTFLELAARTTDERGVQALEDNVVNLAAETTDKPECSRSVSRKGCDKAGERAVNSPNGSMGVRPVSAAGVINSEDTQAMGFEVGERGTRSPNVNIELVDSDRTTLKDKGKNMDIGDRLNLAAAAIHQLDASGLGSNPLCDKVGERAASSHNASFGERLGLTAEAIHRDELSRSGELGERVESLQNAQNLVVSDKPATRDKEIQKVNMPLKRKHVPIHRRYRVGVKITETEDLGTNTSCRKYDSLSTPEVNEVQGTFKSTSLELQTVANEPHPDASNITRNTNHEPSNENQANKDLEVHNPSMTDKVDSLRAKEANSGNPSSSHQNNVHRPSLMERNSTAVRHEWNDSADSSPEKSLHLPTPKRRIVSPLKKPENTKFARRRMKKKWSLLEEDTLRAGVQKYGKGNWKLILTSYPDIFEERTEVDLKDKWRNMSRY